jgi:glycosyltransferase involved in cell wall biosynthesis
VREALALGRRVVATAVGTRPPGVELCPPNDAAALAEAMLRALDREPPAPSVERHVDGVEAALAAYQEVRDA